MDELSIKAPDIETRMFQLSGGNQQKVVLAKLDDDRYEGRCSLTNRPGGLMWGRRQRIYRLISEMAESGLGVVMVSSEMPELIASATGFWF